MKNPKHVARVKNVEHDTVTNGMTIVDNRKPKVKPVDAMVAQIKGETRNGSTQLLRNFGLWCTKHSLNADNYIDEAKEKELTQIAIRNGKRIRELKLLSATAIAEAQTMNNPAPLKGFLGGITKEDREASDIRKIIFYAEKALKAYSL